LLQNFYVKELAKNFMMHLVNRRRGNNNGHWQGGSFLFS
jgi:hypothetical protein